jgi:DNA-directed RNA polymerase I subunit RPA43
MCALNASSHRLTVANQMLSLVGSIQPDPFSPEHIPQTKPDRAAQSPQPSPRLLSEPVESEGMEEGLEEEEENLATRGKKKREKEKGKVEKTKRKRKEDNAVAAKSERKSKRKKTS